MDWVLTGGNPVLVLAQVTNWGHPDLVRSTMSLEFLLMSDEAIYIIADMVGFWPLKTCGYLSPCYVSLNCIHLFVYIQVFLGNIVGSIPTTMMKQRMQQSKRLSKVNTVIKQVKIFISHCI